MNKFPSANNSLAIQYAQKVTMELFSQLDNPNTFP